MKKQQPITWIDLSKLIPIAISILTPIVLAILSFARLEGKIDLVKQDSSYTRGQIESVVQKNNEQDKTLANHETRLVKLER